MIASPSFIGLGARVAHKKIIVKMLRSKENTLKALMAILYNYKKALRCVVVFCALKYRHKFRRLGPARVPRVTIVEYKKQKLFTIIMNVPYKSQNLLREVLLYSAEVVNC